MLSSGVRQSLPSQEMTGAMHKQVLLLVAAISVAAAAAAGDVDSFSYPVFDNATAQDLVVATNASVLTSAALLFEADDAAAVAAFNRSEGFLLLARTVDVWRAAAAGGGGAPALEASFNTSFTLTGAAAPVAFVVLRDSFPPLHGEGGLRGFANYSASDGGAATRNASGSVASVEVGPVRSYGPDSPAVGLNVTVTATAGTAAAVWIEYDAAAHRLSVYVAGGGGAGEASRPAAALLDARVDLAGRRTTEKGMVGFFAGSIQDVLVGVRRWNLTVDRFDSSGSGGGGGGRKKKGAATWWVMMMMLLGSVAAMA